MTARPIRRNAQTPDRNGKIFTLLLLLYRTSVKSQGMKQLMAGGGVALIGTTLVPLLDSETLYFQHLKVMHIRLSP